MIHRTDDELRKLAVDIVDGHVFTSDMCPNTHDVGNVFMVLQLGGLSKMKEDDIKEIGLFYEYNEKAMPYRRVNGMPIFFSAQILSKEDCKRAQVFVDQYKEMKSNFFVEPKV